jgi:ribulose kinase
MFQYGTKHIAETFCQHGHKLQASVMCGGLARNDVFVQTLADVLGFPLLLPKESESVMLGAAILGACAAKSYSDMHEAILGMAGIAASVTPAPHEYMFVNNFLCFNQLL